MSLRSLRLLPRVLPLLPLSLAGALAAAAAACGASPPAPEPAVVVIPPTVSAPAAGGEAAPAPDTRVKPRSGPAAMAWEASEPTARERARREGRPLLVYLRAAWAVAALSMERDVWSDPRVLAAARPFVPLKLDLTGGESDAEGYAERYGAEQVPAVVLFDRDGRRATLLLGLQRADVLAGALRAAAE